MPYFYNHTHSTASSRKRARRIAKVPKDYAWFVETLRLGFITELPRAKPVKHFSRELFREILSTHAPPLTIVK